MAKKIIVRSGTKRQKYSRVPDKKDYIWVLHKMVRARTEEYALYALTGQLRKIKAKARQRLGLHTEEEMKSFIKKCDLLIEEEREAERRATTPVKQAFLREEEREIQLQLSGSQSEQRGAE